MDNQRIEQEAQEKFQKNMLYFQQNAPGIYEQFMAFENAIANGYYIPKYNLEYKEEGYFDVQEIESGNWLYGINSNKHAEIIAKTVDYSKQDNLFETFRDLTFTQESLKRYEAMDIVDSSLSTIAPIVHYTNQHASKATTMKKIYKFIFMGVGLGLHLIKVHEKIHATTYFIVEDDLELFYLSLYVTDYQLLKDDGVTIIFSIFDDEETFRYKVYSFLRTMPVYNHYLKYFLLLSHSTEKLKIMHSAIISQDYLKFPHSAVMQVYLRPLEYLQQQYKFVNINALQKASIFHTNPILVLGAGPSLQKDIEWVKKNKGQFIVIAVSAALGLLEKNNIKPDIIIHVDGFEASMKHLDKVSSMEFFNESIALFASFTYPDFAKAFKKENIYIFQAAASIKRDYGHITASNVGIMSYVLSIYFGAKQIYTLGLDMALDAETGQTHLEGHLHSKKLDIKHKLDLEENIDYHETVLSTKGNFLEEIPTTPHFIASLMEIKGIVRNLQKEEQHAYNLSDGAYIANTTPLRSEDFDDNVYPLLDKDKLFQELKSTFEDASEIGLTEEEFKDIQQRVVHAKNILKRIEEFKTLKFSSIDQYHYDLLGLFIDILTENDVEEAKDTNNIITLYIQMISGYLFDFINTKEIDNPKRHIKKLNKLLVTQLTRVVTYYEEFLEDFLKSVEHH